MKKTKSEITSKTKFSEILKKDNKAAEILMSEGMSCLGCPMAMEETIGEGCMAHGMSKEETQKLIKKLNRGKK
jgi:hybrid cluster-associated redox disulfide protein